MITVKLFGGPKEGALFNADLEPGEHLVVDHFQPGRAFLGEGEGDVGRFVRHEYAPDGNVGPQGIHHYVYRGKA